MHKSRSTWTWLENMISWLAVAESSGWMWEETIWVVHLHIQLPHWLTRRNDRISCSLGCIVQQIFCTLKLNLSLYSMPFYQSLYFNIKSTIRYQHLLTVFCVAQCCIVQNVLALYGPPSETCLQVVYKLSNLYIISPLTYYVLKCWNIELKVT